MNKTNKSKTRKPTGCKKIPGWKYLNMINLKGLLANVSSTSAPFFPKDNPNNTTPSKQTKTLGVKRERTAPSNNITNKNQDVTYIINSGGATPSLINSNISIIGSNTASKKEVSSTSLNPLCLFDSISQSHIETNYKKIEETWPKEEPEDIGNIDVLNLRFNPDNLRGKDFTAFLDPFSASYKLSGYISEDKFEFSDHLSLFESYLDLDLSNH